MEGQDFALRGGGYVTLRASELIVTGRAAHQREYYAAIRAVRPGEYGLGTQVYYVTCRTDTGALDLDFSDRDTRDAFLAALRARLA